jgi:hypothetical protein
LRDLI